MSIPVFLSVGRTSTPQQEEFVRAVERLLETHELTPQTVGRTYFRNQQPLKSVEECMQSCAGTIILAFERIHIQSGIERRGSPESEQLEDTNLPTVWNQIEATMAYTLGHPLFVLVEHNLRSEGLLERGYDWYVKWFDLDNTDFNDREFMGLFRDWRKHVEEYDIQRKTNPIKKDATIDPETLTVYQILKSLRPSQLWSIGVAFVSLLAGIAYLAYYLGTIAP